MSLITNETELQAAASVAGPHTINAGTYTLTSDLSITGADWDLTLLGNVIIDGNSLTYDVSLDTDSGIITGDYSLTFQNLSAAVRVLATTARHFVVFGRTDFVGSGTNGLEISGAVAGEVAVVCNDCRAYNNDDDGFSIVGTATGANVVMVLNRCEAFWNDNVDGGGGTGGGAGDGATCHTTNQTLVVNGGTYHDNGKCGIVCVGQSSAIISGPSVYDNGQVVATNPNAEIRLETRHATVRNVGFHCTANGGNIPFLYSLGKGVKMVNCRCNMANFSGGWSSVGLSINPLDFGGGVSYNYVDNCTIYNIPTNKYGLYTYNDSVFGIATNCVFHGTGSAAYNKSDNFIITQSVINITGSASTYNAIRCASNEYTNNDANGFNIFFGQASEADYFSGDAGGFKLTDLDADPKFKDAANFNFNTGNDSPCYITDVERIGIDMQTVQGNNNSVAGATVGLVGSPITGAF